MKARHIALSKRVMTIAELQEPEAFELTRPVGLSVSAPTRWQVESADFRHAI